MSSVKEYSLLPELPEYRPARLGDRRDALRVSLNVDEIAELLAVQGDAKAALYEEADRVRSNCVGDEIYLRGIVEFSNICRKNCDYCGIRGQNESVKRYRMDGDEIVELAIDAKKHGYTTVVLQSGEDLWYTAERICGIVRAVKRDAGIAVTLSIGDRPMPELVKFREAGCDRWLMRFETCDTDLFKRLHPDDDLGHRVRTLLNIRRAGIQLGSGFLIGLPGQGLHEIAREIAYATRLRLDMIGCGPFIPSPGTPMADTTMLEDKDVYYKTISVLRLLNPYAHLPATTAFDAVFPDGRDNLLRRGCNVFMPNVTPQKYRSSYQLYPGKPCIDEDGDQCSMCVKGRIMRLGRHIGSGPGHTKLPST